MRMDALAMNLWLAFAWIYGGGFIDATFFKHQMKNLFE